MCAHRHLYTGVVSIAPHAFVHITNQRAIAANTKVPELTAFFWIVLYHSTHFVMPVRSVCCRRLPLCITRPRTHNVSLSLFCLWLCGAFDLNTRMSIRYYHLNWPLLLYCLVEGVAWYIRTTNIDSYFYSMDIAIPIGRLSQLSLTCLDSSLCIWHAQRHMTLSAWISSAKEGINVQKLVSTGKLMRSTMNSTTTAFITFSYITRVCSVTEFNNKHWCIFDLHHFTQQQCNQYK